MSRSQATIWATLSALALLTGCSDSTTVGPETATETTVSQEPTSASGSPDEGGEDQADTTKEESEGPPVVVGDLSILSGGDILIHPSVWESSARGDGTFDFAAKFEHILDWTTGADLALCSLEVPIAPKGEQYTGYPMFGAPPDLISSMKEAGFDGCNLATNHTMDRGFPGVEHTIELLEGEGMGYTGAARSEEEFNETQFFTLSAHGQEITVAHLSATTLTNGLYAPADKPWSWFVVGELGPYEVDDIIAQAERAREEGADLVVLSMHWGTEYVSAPIDEQLIIGDQLAQSGAIDLVFGNHSHVPQPVTKLDGGPEDRGMWVVWSMGNLISGQTIANHGHRVTTGILATATVDVYSDGSAEVSGLDWTVVTQDRPGGNMLYPLTDLVEGDRPPGMALPESELTERGNVTYPVMNEDGSSERRDPPEGTAEVEVSRR